MFSKKIPQLSSHPLLDADLQFALSLLIGRDQFKTEQKDEKTWNEDFHFLENFLLFRRQQTEETESEIVNNL